NRQMEVDYPAVPHAVFTDPEVAGVGMGEREAIDTHGKDAIRIGFYRYEDTGKGLAVDAGDYFVKVIVAAEDHRILGAHMVGPWASMLIHEVIPLMYTPDGSLRPLLRAMHIHPAMSEVVQRAAGNLMDVDDYHHLIGHHYGLPFAATG
ncbi:MAG: dihydrolipoyl dehydrogenase, partial [Candidatus Thermoplasmatota archaeon]|nr:dihydrolipoyl dehydrogenase [Candidatus Thermoplasmatota archaeon]